MNLSYHNTNMKIYQNIYIKSRRLSAGFCYIGKTRRNNSGCLDSNFISNGMKIADRLCNVNWVLNGGMFSADRAAFPPGQFYFTKLHSERVVSQQAAAQRVTDSKQVFHGLGRLDSADCSG